MEIWRDVVGYEGIYEVSNTGQVRTRKDKITHSVRHGKRTWKQRVLKQKVTKDNTCRVSLYKDKTEQTWLVHRIVALAFIPLVEGKDFINHIDGNRLNNSVENLEWCTYKENANHAFDTGLMPCHNVIIYDTNTKQTFTFRSKARASEFLGKNHGYVSGLLKKGKNRYSNYMIKEKRAN
jgi:hypothetical protein